jgi:translocation and assembly module TamA
LRFRFAPTHFAAVLLIAASAVHVAPAMAQAVDYEVEIDAPEGVKIFLTENLALFKWRGNERVDAEQLRRLVDGSKAEIEILLAADGFYAPTIESKLEQSGNKWFARIKVEPNKLVRVGEVKLEFAGAIVTAPATSEPKIDELRAEWTIAKDDIFRQSSWEAAKKKLIQDLILVRYPQATLADTRAEVNVETGIANLLVKVDSGPAVTFGELTINGRSRYPASTIVNLNPIRPGRTYRQSLLLEYQRRLQDTGYFQRVDVSAEVPTDVAGDAATAVAPVVVTVEELKLQRVELGAGFSTNTGSRGQATYERLNLFDTAIKLKLSSLLETKKQSGTASFIFPVNADGVRDSIATTYLREDVQNEVTRTTGISATRAWGRPVWERSITLQYGRERRDVSTDNGFSTTYSQSLVANFSSTWRRTDNLLSPTRGYLLNLQAGGAPVKLFSSTRFARLYGKATGYFPVGESNTLILRGEAGAIAADTRNGIPTDFLFRAGGDQSLRGYGYQQLGVTDGSAIVGGRYLAVGSAEVIHWLSPRYPNWGIAGFVDGGNAADKPSDLKPVYGYGVGARWRSPVGVINLDVAYGQKVREARMHFSLGISF